ncbi:TPA: hypothetical protein HA318_01625 [Candidatus Micrarchaeota archaeon]|nr:hypothetical protein [Candidatus Micrarchaeota archaeon]
MARLQLYWIPALFLLLNGLANALAVNDLKEDTPASGKIVLDEKLG